MYNIITHKKVLSFIRAIRLSFLEAGIVYTSGACYGFYTILKEFSDGAEAYTNLPNKSHIITKIGSKFYDIQGEYINKELQRTRP